MDGNADGQQGATRSLRRQTKEGMGVCDKWWAQPRHTTTVRVGTALSARGLWQLVAGLRDVARRTDCPGIQNFRCMIRYMQFR